MRTHFLRAIALLPLAVVLGGCLPPAPPYPVLEPAIITSVEFVPDVVVPGEPFTIRITATHDLGIDAARGGLRTPGGWYPESGSGCAGAGTPATPGANSTEGIVELDCVLANGAPNGNWTADLIVYANTAPETHATNARQEFEFLVVGGANDNESPTVTETQPAPATVSRGGSFTIRGTAVDAHAPISLRDLDFTPFLDCIPGADGPWGEATLMYTLSCSVDADRQLGTTSGSYRLMDKFGNTTPVPVSFEVVP